MFTVTLPLVATASTGEAPSHVFTGVIGDALPDLDGTTVLVVDDDSDSLKLVAIALGKCGAEVVQATSVAAAVESLEQSTPAVIVSDIAMPTQDGIDLLRHVRALDAPLRNVPMVALTAFTSDEDRRRILAAGFNEYMSKPVAPLQLMRLVAALRDAGLSPSTIH